VSATLNPRAHVGLCVVAAAAAVIALRYE